MRSTIAIAAVIALATFTAAGINLTNEYGMKGMYGAPIICLLLIGIGASGVIARTIWRWAKNRRADSTPEVS